MVVALRDLAAQIEQLVPSWTRPENFWERRSEIAGQLRALAAQLERDLLSVLPSAKRHNNP